MFYNEYSYQELFIVYSHFTSLKMEIIRNKQTNKQHQLDITFLIQNLL